MRPEQEALLAKARSSLAATELLMEEEHYDFCVSRAYYTMYYLAEAILLTENLAFSKHSATISSFGQYFVKTGKIPKEYHSYLIKGQDDRLVGDYNFQELLGKEDAEIHLQRAKQFLTFTERYLSNQ